MAHINVPVRRLPGLLHGYGNAYTGPYGHAVLLPTVHHHGDYLTGTLGKGVGRIAATVAVKLPPEVPIRAKVRLMRERDGRVMRETWSHPVTGAYAFEDLDELEVYTALTYHPQRDYRAEVADGLIPDVPPPRKGLLT